MNVDTHIHVTVDENGDPVAAYQTIREARDAVEIDDYRHAEEVDYHPDVPLSETEEGA